VPEIFIVAGPNGAGKTSFANEYLRTGREQIVFVSVDEIARRLEEPPLGKVHRDMRAGRVMLEQIEGLVSTGTSFMFETTLTSLVYAQKIPVWRQLGYRTALTYLRLSNVEMSLQRVRKRVAAGGHGIPEDVIRRRFDKSADYFQRIYKPIVDEWYVWDSLEGEFRIAESWTAL
jgi:predicted ABC-type ATPase